MVPPAEFHAIYYDQPAVGLATAPTTATDIAPGLCGGIGDARFLEVAVSVSGEEVERASEVRLA
jgi:hypothetical protein